MVNLTFEELDLTVAKVKLFLDIRSAEFLQDETIVAVLQRSYNYVSGKITINEENQVIVIDAIQAISTWQCYGIFGQSISNVLQIQDIDAYKTNLEYYKSVAAEAATNIGITLIGDSSASGESTTDEPEETTVFKLIGGSLLG